LTKLWIENTLRVITLVLSILKKLIILLILLLLVSATAFAVLTKTGAIPNYLRIEILCPESEDVFPENLYRDPNYQGGVVDLKPVIYLYPQEELSVNVDVNYSGDLFVTYPEYKNGWEVIASPDGTIINKEDGKEYSYLFWEGRNTEEIQYDMTTGYVVAGADTAEFLQNKLSELGLLTKEYNEFIVFWLPQMIENEYNLIHFATENEYHNRVGLDISPEPDSVLRVFMVFKELDEEIEVQPQKFETFKRDGFTVIEWGGTELKD